MKFNAREDIEAPVAQVYGVLTDYDIFERAALRRGAEVVRSDLGGRPVWRVAFRFRGRQRELTIRQDSAQPPVMLVFSGAGKQVQGTVTVELVELGPRRTRMTVATEIQPRTLAARLFLQSIKLARTRIVKRYQTRIAQLANIVEARTRSERSGV